MDALDVDRIYRFFGITFQNAKADTEELNKSMDLDESELFAKNNPLFIFKNAELLMLYSTDARMRIFAAFSYL